MTIDGPFVQSDEIPAPRTNGIASRRLKMSDVVMDVDLINQLPCIFRFVIRRPECKLCYRAVQKKTGVTMTFVIKDSMQRPEAHFDVTFPDGIVFQNRNPEWIGLFKCFVLNRGTDLFKR